MVRTTSNIEQWIRLFLVGVAETAEKSKKTFECIITLRHRLEMEILTLGKRAKTGQQLLKILYSRPIVTAKIVGKQMSITHPAANQLLKDFQKIGILQELTGFKRNRLFAFKEYLDLFGKRPIMKAAARLQCNVVSVPYIMLLPVLSTTFEVRAKMCADASFSCQRCLNDNSCDCQHIFQFELPAGTIVPFGDHAPFTQSGSSFTE